jgi:hypothetical protein
MPVENPKRSRRSGRFVKGGARRRRRTTTRRRTVRRRRTNPGLMVVNRGGRMAKRRRTRRTSTRRRTTRRRRNPAGLSLGRGFALPPMKQVAGGLAGVLIAQALPNLAMPAQNKGLIGAVLELVAAIVGSQGLRMIAGPEVARAALVGGGIRATYRVLSEQGLLKSIPGLAGTEAVGPVPGFAGYIDAPLTGFVDSDPAPQFPAELEFGGFQSDYEFTFQP